MQNGFRRDYKRQRPFGKLKAWSFLSFCILADPWSFLHRLGYQGDILEIRINVESQGLIQGCAIRW